MPLLSLTEITKVYSSTDSRSNAALTVIIPFPPSWMILKWFLGSPASIAYVRAPKLPESTSVATMVPTIVPTESSSRTENSYS